MNINIQEFLEKIQNDEKDFSNTTILPLDKNYTLSNLDLSNCNFENAFLDKIILEECDLEGANFSNAKIRIRNGENRLPFHNSNLKNANFEGVKPRLEPNILITIDRLFSDVQYEEIKGIKKSSIIRELRNVSEKQTNSLIEGFENLVEEYLFEEKFWIRIVSLIAFFLMYIVFLPILLQFYKTIYIILIPASFFFILYTYLVQQLQKKPKQTLYKFEEKLESFLDFCYDYGVFILSTGLISFFVFGIIPKMPLESINFSFSQYYFISPIIILFVTLLYFSITQYSKSKKLRIDNQNKIALIHGMMAIKADTTNMEKGRFYDKIADIVFDRVHHEKEENLPLDKIIQLIKAINPKDSQK